MYKNFTLQKCATIVIAVIILDWHIKLRNKFWKVIYNECLQNSHIYVRSKLSFLKLWLHISQEDVACGAMCKAVSMSTTSVRQIYIISTVLCSAVYFVFAHLCHRHSDHSRPPWAAAGLCWSRGRWPWGNSQPRHPLHRSPGHWRAPPTRDRQFFSVVSLVILLTIYLSEVIVFLSQYGDLPL